MLKDVSLASGRSHSTRGSLRSHRRLASVCQLTRQPPDVTGSHEQQQVAFADDLLQPLPYALEIGAERGPRHHLRQLPRAEVVGVGLARRVNLGDDQLVGAFESEGE